MIPIIVIAGPTASGKTALAIEVAKALDGEVISADSMQIYKRMNIGTAKPTEEEMCGIKHHLIDILEPWEGFSVDKFVTLAKEAAFDIYSRGKMPILAGGTGLYIDTLIHGIKLAENAFDEDIRKRLEEEANANGKTAMYEKLCKIDPESAAKLHPNDLKRVIRALEIYENTGMTKTESDMKSNSEEKIFDYLYFFIETEREILYNKINMRVDKMVEQGLFDEALDIYRKIGGKNVTAMQSIGYRELKFYFDGLLARDEAINLIKRNTRRLAKRQITWFKRDSEVIKISASDDKKVILLAEERWK
ncbi:MAG: tRNA (adenosine(37)-N6)-dimethylallyltransferase MiaA [Clostridia bacterium]|nr:tRNA (adenosine(37)-N6)-dimethylallyltransferase MiaA [Clostridia bacterium]